MTRTIRITVTDLNGVILDTLTLDDLDARTTKIAVRMISPSAGVRPDEHDLCLGEVAK